MQAAWRLDDTARSTFLFGPLEQEVVLLALVGSRMFAWTRDALSWAQSWMGPPQSLNDGTSLGTGPVSAQQNCSGAGFRILAFDGNEYTVWSPPLAVGGYASVYAASRTGCSLETRETARFVVKETRYVEHAQVRQAAEKEVVVYRYIESQRVQRQLNASDYVVRFLGSCLLEQSERSLFLLLERVRGGSLAELFEREALMIEPLAETRWLHVAHDLLSAMQFLHSLRPFAVVHGDIKLENVLYDAKARHWLLCDLASAQLVPKDCIQTSSMALFGSSMTKNIDPNGMEALRGELQSFDASEVQTTWWYRAPETIDGWTATESKTQAPEKQDIWACGCILFTLAYGFHPFADNGTLQILSGAPWERVPDTRLQQYTDLVEELLHGLLAVDVDERWSADEALAFLEGDRPQSGSYTSGHGTDDRTTSPEECLSRKHRCSSVHETSGQDDWANFSDWQNHSHLVAASNRTSEQADGVFPEQGLTEEASAETALFVERSSATDELLHREPAALSSALYDLQSNDTIRALYGTNAEALFRAETSPVHTSAQSLVRHTACEAPAGEHGGQTSPETRRNLIDFS